MGDVLSLIEKAEAAAEEDEKEALERRLRAGEFTFDDFLASYRMLQNMGPLKSVVSLIPGLGNQLKGVDIDEGQLRRVEAIVLSMTPAERARSASDQRLAPVADREGEWGHRPAGQPAADGSQADGEDDEAVRKRQDSRVTRNEIRRQMAVRMRLTRVGGKKNPIYRVVVADSRSPRDGKFLEIIGRYNPQTEPSTIEFDEEKVKEWLGKGAQPSQAVSRLLKAKNIG